MKRRGLRSASPISLLLLLLLLREILGARRISERFSAQQSRNVGRGVLRAARENGGNGTQAQNQAGQKEPISIKRCRRGAEPVDRSIDPFFCLSFCSFVCENVLAAPDNRNKGTDRRRRRRKKKSTDVILTSLFMYCIVFVFVLYCIVFMHVQICLSAICR
jgi:hypothetical protein